MTSSIMDRAVAAYHEAVTDFVDPRSRSWVLCSSPAVPIAIMMAYMFFVQWLGPRLMANRAAFNLRPVMVPYNAIQVACNGYLTWKGWSMWFWQGYSFVCQPVDHSTTEENEIMAHLVYCYYLLKIADLLDTVFFVLRKKGNQVSFLHVYHHCGMVFLGYIACRFSLNGHFFLLGSINAVVHTALYTYYLMTALWPAARGVSWKKYITILQLTQFAVLLVHNTLPLLQPACGVQKIWCAILVAQSSFMLILFSDFYIKAYSSPKTRSSKTD